MIQRVIYTFCLVEPVDNVSYMGSQHVILMIQCSYLCIDYINSSIQSFLLYLGIPAPAMIACYVNAIESMF